MPNVRDSSGTIGTMRSPIAGSRTSVLRMRTNAIVVEFARSPLPSSTVVNGSGVGIGSAAALRAGRLPPRAARRSSRYCSSGLSSGGRWKNAPVASSSLNGRPSRSRIASRASSFIAFCWWVMFRPSPAMPMPYPLIVFARITVGWPVVRTAAA